MTEIRGHPQRWAVMTPHLRLAMLVILGVPIPVLAADPLAAKEPSAAVEEAHQPVTPRVEGLCEHELCSDV